MAEGPKTDSMKTRMLQLSFKRSGATGLNSDEEKELEELKKRHAASLSAQGMGDVSKKLGQS